MSIVVSQCSKFKPQKVFPLLTLSHKDTKPIRYFEYIYTMQFYSADRVFDGKKFLPNEAVLAVDEGGFLRDILVKDNIDPLQLQTLKGVITPGFINAHCHTELSHLRSRIPQKTGLPAFGKHIMMQRFSASKDEVKERLVEADREMKANGIVAVGDICNGDDSFDMKANSSLYYHSFIELLGLHPDKADAAMSAGLQLIEQLKQRGLSGSIAPHAPYSTSKKLIEKISAFNIPENLPSSIHNQETEDENNFFYGRENGFFDLYKFLQMDLSWFTPPMTDSLPYYIDSLGSQRTLLVHNTFSSESDITLASQRNVFWCFCPAANKYIEDRLPSFHLFKGHKNRICLGTDSLASNLQLDLTYEANLLLGSSDYTEEEVLRSMTSIPAEALGISAKFGELKKDSRSGLNLIELKNRNIKFIKTLNA
jgi:cytosine/adenosine deaminase-related metal-dependent hydrolase